MKCVEVEVDSERLHVEMVNYTLAVIMGVILKRLIEWCSEETRRDASILEDRLKQETFRFPTLKAAVGSVQV